MKKQQIFLVAGGFLLLILLFFFGNQIAPPKATTVATSNEANPPKTISTDKLLVHAKEKLNSKQLEVLLSLENSVKRGDVKNQQIKSFRQLATYWKYSLQLFEPYAYYTSEAAKLENSEKSLTFSKRSFAFVANQFCMAGSDSVCRLLKNKWAAKVRLFSEFSNLAASEV